MSIGTVNPSTFEWTIPSLRKLLLEDLYGVWSPDFHLSDSTWFLYLFLGFHSLQEWIGIYLYRGDSGAPKTITYTIKFKGRNDVAKITKTNCFDTKYARSGEPMFLKKEVAWNTIFLNSSTITCNITCDTPHPVTGKEYVTFIVQPPVPNSLSCAIQKEVANSVTDKGNFKDDDLSSFDMKGVAVLSERMKELFINGGDHDVTICVQDKEFRAHRSILRARSPVFAKMLAHDTKENITGTISIEDCDPESFDEFLLYVYSGRTENLTPSNALQLYYPADKYDFPVLKERCVSFLKTSLSVASICDVVLLAAKHQEKELLGFATEFFARNVKKILVTVGWQNFMSQNPVEANELYIKSMEILHPEN